jgi:6-phosphofructokinase 1
MRVFLSYNFKDDQRFVRRVNHYLARQPALETYSWLEDREAGDWALQLNDEIEKSDAFVLFLGKEVGQTQRSEAFAGVKKRHRVLVALPGAQLKHKADVHGAGLDPLHVETTDEQGAERCAKDITRLLGRKWFPWDEIPDRYLFDYEKAIIEAYALGEEELDPACPERWPDVAWTTFERTAENPVPKEVIGGYRGDNSKILVDAREALRPTRNGVALTFREAGPRQMLSFPRPRSKVLTVGILVSGGIAPGINATIEGIVARHILYREKFEERYRERYQLNLLGYMEGLKALLRPGAMFKELTEDEVRQAAHAGGSMLGTSRAEELLDPDPAEREKCLRKAVRKLYGDGVDILYVIGGDGSMRAAHALWKAREEEQELSVVAIPKTMDNDILWVWQSFGFLSAVDRAREAISHLSTEIQANPRLCIIQLFGSDSGFVVSHAALASGAGACDAALIPEMPFSMKVLSKYVQERLAERYSPGKNGMRPYGMIVMAETAIPTDAEEYLDDEEIGLDDEERDAIRAFIGNGRRVRGQTPDALRTGGLKIVARVLERDVRAMEDAHEYWRTFRVFTSEPRYLIRASPPSVSDVISGLRLGGLAVDNAMAGYTDFMVSQWLTEYVLVPLRLVVLGRKRVPLNGIFWKSVLAMTGQPAELDRPPKRPKSRRKLAVPTG